jgi:hypothetical protein
MNRYEYRFAVEQHQQLIRVAHEARLSRLAPTKPALERTRPVCLLICALRTLVERLRQAAGTPHETKLPDFSQECS